VSFASPLAARDTLRCALPSLVCPACAHRSDSCAAGAPPSSPRRVPAPPPLPRDSNASLEVSNLPAPLIRPLLPWLARDCSPELPRASVSLPRCVQRPLVLPCQRDAHGRVCQTALNAPELVPNPLEPRRGQPPRLRRDLAAGPSDATTPVSAPSR
jgi:hypothetical protein